MRAARPSHPLARGHHGTFWWPVPPDVSPAAVPGHPRGCRQQGDGRGPCPRLRPPGSGCCFLPQVHRWPGQRAHRARAGPGAAGSGAALPTSQHWTLRLWAGVRRVRWQGGRSSALQGSNTAVRDRAGQRVFQRPWELSGSLKEAMPRGGERGGQVDGVRPCPGGLLEAACDRAQREHSPPGGAGHSLSLGTQTPWPCTPTSSSFTHQCQERDQLAAAGTGCSSGDSSTVSRVKTETQPRGGCGAAGHLHPSPRPTGPRPGSMTDPALCQGPGRREAWPGDPGGSPRWSSELLCPARPSPDCI